MSPSPPILVVGGGLVGLASALRLAEAGLPVTVLEAEERVASHQSAHNSGVLHSGLYYRPGSLKARLTARGRRALLDLAAEEGIEVLRCGKLVVATRPEELPRLDELERRGHANGLGGPPGEGLERLDAAGIRRREPEVAGLAALWVPQAAIVDFPGVARALVARLEAAGGRVETGARVTAVAEEAGEVRVETTAGEWAGRALVNCAGLHSDRVAALARRGAGETDGRRSGPPETRVRILPVRGEYWRLPPAWAERVRSAVYPVPDPALPFLGVHLTPTLDGHLEAGPNAVPAFHRHGYRWSRVSLAETASLAADPAVWRFLVRHAGTIGGEVLRSLSRRASARALARLVPAVEPRDLSRGAAGVRAQALGPDGRLLDDFHILQGERSVHVVNAPSPAATACLAIGAEVARCVRERLGD